MSIDTSASPNALARYQFLQLPPKSGEEDVTKTTPKYYLNKKEEQFSAYGTFVHKHYRTALDRALPEAYDQAVADAGTSFEFELPGLLEWRFSETEARRVSQPTLSVLGGDSEALWPRLGETHRLLLTWLPHVEEDIVPRTTHFMQIEDPRGTAKVLAAFWARHPLVR